MNSARSTVLAEENNAFLENFGMIYYKLLLAEISNLIA